jgi:hypothetical protein
MQARRRQDHPPTLSLLHRPRDRHADDFHAGRYRANVAGDEGRWGRDLEPAEVTHDFSASALVKWHPDEEEPPESWSGATAFATLREALDAIVNGAPQTGHPWVRCGGRIYSPHEVEDLWREDRMI